MSNNNNNSSSKQNIFLKNIEKMEKLKENVGDALWGYRTLH